MLPQMSEAITLRAWRLKEESSICMEMGQGDSCRKDVHGYFYRPPPPKKKSAEKRCNFKMGKASGYSGDRGKMRQVPHNRTSSTDAEK